MGYESKFYIVEKSNLSSTNDQGKKWAKVIASFDMCKISAPSWLHKYPETEYYFYADDGNTQVTEDKYGEPIIEIPIKDLINILEGDPELQDYRRTAPFVAMLKGFDQNKFEGEIVALHYGY